MKKLALALFLSVAVTQGIWGQGCSVCTKTTQGFDDKSARGLNGGIIYLAFLPLGIMGTLAFLYWRYNKNN